MGPVVSTVSPNGQVFVGSIRDSAWGAGNNIGEIVVLSFAPEETPAGIAEMRALPDGFRLCMTATVDVSQATQLGNYRLQSYRRIATASYGGDDLDRRTEQIQSIDVSKDRTFVDLHLEEMREGYVYELRIGNMFGKNKLTYPPLAHYTLHRKPRD